MRWAPGSLTAGGWWANRATPSAPSRTLAEANNGTDLGARTGGIASPLAASTTPGTVVRIDNATKGYEGQPEPAVKDIVLDIGQGEFFSLLGPSGSGKTTTLRLIAGFEQPDSGAVWLDGNDVTHTPPFERDVNTVFQTYALFPHMTVERNVAYPLRMKKIARDEIKGRVAEEIARVGMGGFEKRLPHQLSGGQRQRIALARALVSRPKVVLLDEPLGALDLKLRQQMQVLLKELQRDVGITFVYVTHDQSEALAMSDRLAVMSEGRIEQIGTPVEVYYRPTTPFVANFIGKANVLTGAFELEGAGSVLRVGDLALQVRGQPRSGPATAAIRYEAIEVCPPEKTPEACSRFEAAVDETIFLGDGLEIILGVAGQRLVARVPARRVPNFRRGDRVLVGIDPDDIVVLHD